MADEDDVARAGLGECELVSLLGLRAHGFADVASELARRTIAMLARGGIREFCNPFTARAMGATDFGWSCLSLDLIAAENVI